jgi:hypothetical protein
MSDEINHVYSFCPLCGKHLEGHVWHFGTAKCPDGHYEYHGQGSYASEADIILDGNKESFYFDDMFGDEEKFRVRVKEIRDSGRFEWHDAEAEFQRLLAEYEKKDAEPRNEEWEKEGF